MKPIEEKKEQKKELDVSQLVKDYLLPTLSIIILILIIVFLTIPTITKISESNNKVKSLEQDLENLNEFKAKLDEFSETEEEMSVSTVVLDKYLPEQSRVSSFIDEMGILASSVGLESTELQGSEVIKETEEEITTEESESTNEVSRRVLVKFNYTGQFNEVYSLFEKINKYKGLLTIQSVSFELSRIGEWDVEIIIASYNLPQDVVDSTVASVNFIRKANSLPIIDQEIIDYVEDRVNAE